MSMHVFYNEGALTGMLLSGSNVELAFLEMLGVFMHVCMRVCSIPLAEQIWPLW